MARKALTQRATLSRSSVDLTIQGQRRLVLDVLSAGGRMWVRGGGSSMHPTIRAGERVLLEPLHRRPRPGEVVAIRRHCAILVHRVVATAAAGIITRGDASLSCDDPVAAAKIIGLVTAVERKHRVVALRPTLRHGPLALLLFGYYTVRHQTAGMLKRWR